MSPAARAIPGRRRWQGEQLERVRSVPPLGHDVVLDHPGGVPRYGRAGSIGQVEVRKPPASGSARQGWLGRCRQAGPTRVDGADARRHLSRARFARCRCSAKLPSFICVLAPSGTRGRSRSAGVGPVPDTGSECGASNRARRDCSRHWNSADRRSGDQSLSESSDTAAERPGADLASRHDRRADRV